MMWSPGAAFLEDWWAETRDPDPSRRARKQRRALAGVLAYERIGLLSSQQAARWRQRLTNPRDGEVIDPGSELGVQARVAAERYLADLVAQLAALGRASEADALRLNAKLDAAIETLHAVGVLDHQSLGSWQEAAKRNRVQAVAGDPEQATPWLQRQAEWPSGPNAQEVIRVIPGGPKRQNDLAITALIVHEEATSLHFHYLGERWAGLGMPDELAGIWQQLERLTPPVLQDDQGNSYRPLSDQPADATFTGASPLESESRTAITAYWLYTPQAPPAASTFSVERSGSTWTLTDRR